MGRTDADQLDLLSFEPSGVHEPEPLSSIAKRLPEGLLLGTLGWAYPSWSGIWSGQETEKDLELHGLVDYAGHPLTGTVCIPAESEPHDERTLRRYRAQLPPNTPVIVEVDHTLTSPRLTRTEFGGTGASNPHFLDFHYFELVFMRPVRAAFGQQVAAVVLRFPSQLHSLGISPEHFAARLGAFLAELPHDVPFAVEIRDPEYLTLDYARALAKYAVSHVYSTAPDMPSFAEQRSLVPSSEPMIAFVTDPAEPQYPSNSQRERACAQLLLEAGAGRSLLIVGDRAGDPPQRLEAIAREYDHLVQG